jgi:hypothetical protein
MTTGRKVLITILAVVGLVAIVVGIVYLTVKIGSLPSFFPGHAAHGRGHRKKRGYLAVGVGVVLLASSLVVAYAARPRRQRA